MSDCKSALENIAFDIEAFDIQHLKSFDIFLISESKLDNTFSINHFAIGSCKVFRRNRNRIGGGLISYINENTPCKL